MFIMLMAGFFLGIILSIISNIIHSKKMLKKAVEKNLGCYDSQTGKFMWYDNNLEYVLSGGITVIDNNHECKIFKINPKN